MSAEGDAVVKAEEEENDKGGIENGHANPESNDKLSTDVKEEEEEDGGDKVDAEVSLLKRGQRCSISKLMQIVLFILPGSQESNE
jgi:hypothetical protein